MNYARKRICEDDETKSYGSYYSGAADDGRLYAVEGESMDGVRMSTRQATSDWCWHQWVMHGSRYTGFRPTWRVP